MVIVLCQCDWGLEDVPAHTHATLSLVRRQDAPERSFWVNNWLPQSGYDVVQVVEEIHFSVPWKALARELLNEAA